jgi:RNA polymerase sigma-70 factor, ECF subfamily
LEVGALIAVALLMEQALDGDAFAALFDRIREPLYAYAMALMLDVPAAEDVVQRAFELAFARRATYRAQLGSADAWLFGIARNVALDEHRRERRRPAVAAGLEPPEAGGPDTALERADRHSALFAALNTLAPIDREVIALKFWADLTNGEIAAVLGCTESNIGTRLHRAIGRLREVCGDLA